MREKKEKSNNGKMVDIGGSRGIRVKSTMKVGLSRSVIRPSLLLLRLISFSFGVHPRGRGGDELFDSDVTRQLHRFSLAPPNRNFQPV